AKSPHRVMPLDPPPDPPARPGRKRAPSETAPLPATNRSSRSSGSSIQPARRRIHPRSQTSSIPPWQLETAPRPASRSTPPIERAEFSSVLRTKGLDDHDQLEGADVGRIDGESLAYSISKRPQSPVPPTSLRKCSG